jgi:hypothetical protein
MKREPKIFSRVKLLTLKRYGFFNGDHGEKFTLR